MFPYKESEYIKKSRKMFEVQWDKKEEIDATIDLMFEKEKKEHEENVWQKTKWLIEVFLWIAMLCVAISTVRIQKNLWNFSNSIQAQNTTLNEMLTKNSNDQLYLAKTQTIFQVLDTLNKSIYQKEYDSIKDNLQNKANITDKKALQDYLNNFENVYMSCHRALIPLTDVKYSYEYLLGDICSNNDVVNATKSWYGWLKKLCRLIFPDSKLAKSANMTTNNCK